MPESKTKIKEKKMKVFYNPEMEDLPFPEPLSYKLLVEVPQGLEDINETEGVKLAGIEEGAMNLSLHDSDDLPEGVINQYLLDNTVTELKLAAQAVTEAKIAVAAVTEAKIAADAITQVKIANAAIVASKIHADYKILEIVGSLPSVGTAGRIVYLTTDGKIYRDNGSAWKQVILPSEVTSHLGGEGVGTIGTTKIDNLAITTPKLAANSVSTEKLVAGSVTADIIAASAVIAEKISAYAVTAIKIASSAITAEKIQAGAVTTDKIQAYAVTSSKVTTGQLITLSAQIANAIINNAHISSLSADKITTGTLTAILVQTAGSGRRVVMETSGGYYANFIAYDTGGTMAGRMYGDSGNCMLVGWLDITANCGAFRPVTNGAGTLGTSSYYWGTAYLGSIYSYSVYPRSSGSYSIGSTSYYWQYVYSYYLYFHSSYGRIYGAGGLTHDWYSGTGADYSSGREIRHTASLTPNADLQEHVGFRSGWDGMGINRRWRTVHAGWIQSGTSPGGGFVCSYAGLPIKNSAIDVIKKLPQAITIEGQQYLKEEDLPSEMKVKSSDGKKDQMELFHMVGISLQSIKEINDRLEAVENKINNP